MLTIGSRLWVAYHYPYPAWTDSLHHTIITQLVAERGQIVSSLAPYFPIPLDMYHLGLYTLSGSTQMLTGAPAHTALLWTAQILNGLCGIGVFLVLDRLLSEHILSQKSSAQALRPSSVQALRPNAVKEWDRIFLRNCTQARLAALCGAAVAGLFSHHPALYVNWGRFTQISGQAILLIAWVVVLHTLTMWSRWWASRHASRHPASAPSSQEIEPTEWRSKDLVWYSIFSALLTAAVFLLHFRVAAFYILLLGISISVKMWQGWQQRRLTGLLLGMVTIGILSIFFVFPALVPALSTFIEANTETIKTLPQDQVEDTIEASYTFPLSSIPYLAARPWLLILTALAALIGLWRRNPIVQISVVWAALMILFAHAYLLGIPVLNVTNLGTVLILLYLPIALIVGAAVSELMTMVPVSSQKAISAAIAIGIVIAGIYGSVLRANELEPHRFFIAEQDVAAMDWIRENTPPDARFAVNTYFWLPLVAHGADAGYWIPYFTQRDTTASAMPILAADWDYQVEILAASQAVADLSASRDADATTDALMLLREHDVGYIYIGANGHFEGGGLNLEQLVQHEALALLYENHGAAILKIVDDNLSTE